MMIKRSYAEDYRLHTAPNMLVKTAYDGRVRGDDRRRLIKYAGEEGAHRFALAKIAEDEVPVLQIGLGATESFGPNRNGDGFPKAACESQHQTFVKLAKAYRDHDNGKDSPSYGRVVDSWFNKDRGRIELLVGLNATKSAAERNDPRHGKVADLELDALEKVGSYPVSMSSRVPYDECSSCGNKARTRSEYCTGSMCKHGGLQSNMGRIMADGHHLHAVNPENNWCDISHITRGRQADRIAYALGQLDGHQKSASASPYTDLAATVHPTRLRPLYSVLRDLADAEELKVATDTALAPAFSSHVYRHHEPEPYGVGLKEACAAAAQAGYILPLEDFLNFATPGAEKYANEVRHALPAVFTALRSDPDVERRLAQAELMASSPIPDSTYHWAQKEARVLGSSVDAVQTRLVHGCLRPGSPLEKNASVLLGPAMELAKEYAAHQIAVRARALGKNEENAVDVKQILSLNTSY